jgi:TonB family protein
VSKARVLRSIPVFDQAAIDAVTQWKFEPTALNGAPVEVEMLVFINFVPPAD